MNRASVVEWHKRFKEATESVRDDERCGRGKEVNTPELIGQRVRLFSVINRTLVWGGVLPLCRGTVGVFYSAS